MSRIPAALLYLTVYNPSIKPSSSNSGVADEDAEEQAQILFYTARERAVSRDRMLRQVGLAKALASFTSMFHPGGEPCQNVHSQTRRMIMLSPEPDFWIHACIELPKTPRPPVVKKKNKKADKGKEQEVVYDYHDGRIHDTALRAHLLRAYEQFKLMHGSFASIMLSLGQQALELQLERFFTVWAWMWDIEEEAEFGKHLGIPLHPSHKLLTSPFDILDPSIPDDAIPFALVPPYLIPSSRSIDLKLPISLARHLLSLTPPRKSVQVENVETDSDAIRASVAEHSNAVNTIKETPAGDAPQTGGFFVMPNVNMPTMTMPNMNLNMDVRKWTWPGYLTFRKTSTGRGTRPSEPLQDEKSEVETARSSFEGGGSKADMSVEADAQSLAEAIASDSINSSEPARVDSAKETMPETDSEETGSITPPIIRPISLLDDNGQSLEEMVKIAEEVSTPAHSPSLQPYSVQPRQTSPEIPPAPLRTLSRAHVHLSNTDVPWLTTRRRIFYLTMDEIIFVLVDGHRTCLEEDGLPLLTETIVKLMGSMLDVISEEKHTSGTETPVTVAKILQPKDSHILSLGDVTLPSPGFHSTSEHLYSGQQMLQGDDDLVEVFSRGQNPQHWHVSRRGLGTGKDGSPLEGEVYLESAHKQSSLADVDNEIAGLVRRALLED